MPTIKERIPDGALDAVFGLLPDALAREAKARTRAGAGRQGLARPLAWADFGRSGTFLRGGLTDLDQASVRLVAASQNDPRVAALASAARAGEAAAGAIVPLGHEDCLWFVPIAAGVWPKTDEAHLRGLYLGHAEFDWSLRTAGAPGLLTAAERRVTFQLVCGLTPRRAAIVDGVSFETKRAQIKSAAARLGLAGQTELVRMAIGHLFALVHASAPDRTRHAAAEDYVARHLADDAHFSIQALPGGRQLRLLTLGPEDGRPVLAIHGMMFPILLRGSSGPLLRHGLKLVVPLRSGFLEPHASFDAMTHDDHIGQFRADMAGLFSVRPELRQAPLLGHSFGATLAIAMAGRLSNAPIVLASPKLGAPPRDDGHASDRFYTGMRALVRSRHLSRHVTDVFKAYYDDPATGTTILTRLFEGSPEDRRIIVGAGASPPVIDWFAELYRTSIHGITDDFCFDMQGWWDRLADLQTRVCVIAGKDDPLTPPDAAVAVAERARRGSIHTIEGGHFIAASAPAPFWQAVAQAAEPAP